MFNGDGDPIDPSGNPFGWLLPYSELGEEFDVYLEQNVEKGLEEWHEAGKRRIVVFVHGGLNTQDGSVDRALDLIPQIKSDAEESAYPIFVNWQSSLISSYRDHLLFLRRGNDFGLLGTVLTPFYAVADIGRILVRTPIVTIEGLWRTAQTYLPNATQEQRVTQRSAEAFLERHRSEHQDSFPIRIGNNRSTLSERFWRAVRHVGTTPVRLVVTPIVDGLGAASWNSMLRRVDVLIEREEDSHEGHTRPGHHSGLLMFFEHVQGFLEEHDPDDWEVVLIGHSMGTIIINRVLAYATTHSSSMPEFDDIVYMAPACSSADFERSVLPYLEMRYLSREPCRLSILTLPQRSELNEENAYGLSPRGSLLLWIDDYFSQPNSEIDHSLGRFSNLMAFFHRVPRHLLSQVRVKAFDHGARESDYSPQKHGDFGRFPFWRMDFWDPDSTPGCDPSLRRLGE